MNALDSLLIRRAAAADFQQCLAIDHGIDSHKVWQMNYDSRHGLPAISFQAARLPRQLRVPYPFPPDVLARRWHSASDAWVASQQGEIRGYVSVRGELESHVAWIHDMAVAPSWRRRGYGSQLLRMAGRWARSRQLTQLLVAVSARNNPGIEMLRKNGLSFCGYNEHEFKSGAIALYFSFRP